MNWIKVAEVIDTFRLVPRVILCGYAIMVYVVVNWYMDYPLKEIVKCDAATLNTLLQNGVSIDIAQTIACQVVDIVNHPTGYTVLVSTIVGAAAIVFGLYTNTGRQWQAPDKSRGE